MNYSNAIVEDLMRQFKNVIGKDFEKYRNHVYRVFINCLLLDNEKTNEEKYSIAAVLHDIGIWTNNTIDYIDPSVIRARQYLTSVGKDEWAEEITQMIYWHHKIKCYNGDYKQTVETFRRADLMDVSLGLFKFGNNHNTLKDSKKQFPNKGFHVFLLKKLGVNFIRHPLNPLPMFKR
ncbi:hypothetical protein QTN47_18275 [Danxiaibacter flavus]|uniref:HD domain-containing protein n=1 Tax=Danxiaibacter flavus TaxID=3049108 RepID=A0ABV3ZIY5_9BACT|nr:hypothetical protein QNM32_18285 [Chitinophagaceae bacterium DXS]